MVTTIVKILSVARGFRAALLDPGCHPILGIIGEDTMGGLARTVLAKTADSANLELGADQFFLEHWDQIDMFAKDFGIAFIGAKFPIWVYFVIGDCMVKLGVLATSWSHVITGFALSIIFSTILVGVIEEFADDDWNQNDEVFAVE